MASLEGVADDLIADDVFDVGLCLFDVVGFEDDEETDGGDVLGAGDGDTDACVWGHPEQREEFYPAFWGLLYAHSAAEETTLIAPECR